MSPVAATSPVPDPWRLRYTAFVPDEEGTREALCTLANGYWGVRGAAAEVDANEVHYPGTYFAGVYNAVVRRVPHDLLPTGATAATAADLGLVVNEEMVNAPNWLPLWFRVGDGPWCVPESSTLLDYCQELDLRRGVLSRSMRILDGDGKITDVRSRRLVSQANPHLAGMEVLIEAHNWSGPITVRTAIDGRVSNKSEAGKGTSATQHLFPRTMREIDDESVLLEMETHSSGIHVAMAARTTVHGSTNASSPARRYLVDDGGMVAHEFTMHARQGRALRFEKVVYASTSRDRAISSPTDAAVTGLQRSPRFSDILLAHERAWSTLWAEFAVELRPHGDEALAVNLNTFHVLQTLGAVDSDLDAGIPARGLHGEGYDGHIFWDELFVYPILTVRRPDLSRTLLGYRYRRLNEARARARQAGHSGAMFPWQSGIDGREVTPRILFNGFTGRWMPDNSHRQRHVGLGIAYSAWQFYESTGNRDFLSEEGAELIVEVARFFASIAEYDVVTDRFSIRRVMGPDEFHDGYPTDPGQGVADNVYTNVMAAWVLRRAVDTIALLAQRPHKPAWERLDVGEDELVRWLHVANRLRVVFNRDGTLSQFAGYDELERLDLQRYREQYGSIGRLDLILNAEGDSTNRYQVSKQPDCLMLLYLLSAEELRELLADMGYSLSPDVVVRTVRRYSDSSTYGSTLSNVVHSWIEARGDRARSWDFLRKALQSDLADIQGGTTRDGIHVGAMAGSIDMLIRCYAGLEMRSGMLWLHPLMPEELDSLAFRVVYRDHFISIALSHRNLTIASAAGDAAPVAVVVNGQRAILAAGSSTTFALTGALSA